MSEKIYAQMAKINSEITAISKEMKNQKQGWKFRGIDQIYDTLHPILAKNGVFILPEVLTETTEERVSDRGNPIMTRLYKIKYNFVADDGSSVSCVVMGEGMDYGDKAGNKAMSIAQKYAFFQVFTIPIEGAVDDPDEDVYETATTNGNTTKGSYTPQVAKKAVKTPSASSGGVFQQIVEIVNNNTKVLKAEAANFMAEASKAKEDDEKLKGIKEDLEARVNELS